MAQGDTPTGRVATRTNTYGRIHFCSSLCGVRSGMLLLCVDSAVGIVGQPEAGALAQECLFRGTRAIALAR